MGCVYSKLSNSTAESRPSSSLHHHENDVTEPKLDLSPLSAKRVADELSFPQRKHRRRKARNNLPCIRARSPLLPIEEKDENLTSEHPSIADSTIFRRTEDISLDFHDSNDNVSHYNDEPRNSGIQRGKLSVPEDAWDSSGTFTSSSQGMEEAETHDSGNSQVTENNNQATNDDKMETTPNSNNSKNRKITLFKKAKNFIFRK